MRHRNTGLLIVSRFVDQEYSRAVTEDEGRKFAERNGIFFVEASAKTSFGVQKAFEEVVKQVSSSSVSNLCPVSDYHRLIR